MNTKNLTQDVSASLVVFLIALPLSMGIALASGVPPALGLLTAVIGGVVVGTFGGAPLQIAGPSAGLTVLVLQMHQEHGIATLGVIVLIAGVIQVGAGVFKLGRQFQAVSPAVIRGMLSGIGILIIASQFHVMIDDRIRESGLQNLLAIPGGIWKAISEYDDLSHDEAALIGVTTLASVVLWDRLKPKKLKIIPGPLLGAVLAAVLAKIFALPINYVAAPEDLLSLLSLPTSESFAQLGDADVLLAGVALAFVASAETLLCAAAVSRMHDRGRTDYDRELAVQGVANTICGLVGTLPMTGVISRSTANVNADAHSRWAAPLHAIWILLFVLFLPDLLALVPTSSLAAILIYIGFKLINPKEIRKLSRFGWPVVVVFGATVIGVVGVDLLKGIVLGLVLSAVRLLYKLSHVHFRLEEAGNRIELHMFGSATFLGLPKLQDALDRVDQGKELHFHFDELEFMDHACIDMLNEFRARYEANGGIVVVEWDELTGMRSMPKTAKAKRARRRRRNSRPAPPPGQARPPGEEE